MKLAPQAPALRAGQPAAIDLSARYLYGAPGSGLDVSGEVTVAASDVSGITGLDGYAVGPQDEPWNPPPPRSKQRASTDAQGPACCRFRCRMLRRRAHRGTHHIAGRRDRRTRGGAQRNAADPAQGTRRRRQEKLRRAAGRRRQCDVRCGGGQPDGTRIANRNVVWSLYKIERRYQWYNSDGRWGYEPVKTITRRMSDGRLGVEPTKAARISDAGRMGHLSTRCQRDRSRRDSADQRVIHRRLVGRPDRRHTRPSRHDARPGELPLGRHDAGPSQPAVRRQGDTRGRRATRCMNPRRRCCCCRVRHRIAGSRRLGTGRVSGGAGASSSRSSREADAREIAGNRVVRYRSRRAISRGESRRAGKDPPARDPGAPDQGRGP